MRSYGQYCALAKALDVLGDRWTLLIVRELLLLGPCRYTDIQDGLPGIATNLLAARLRELEAAGVVRSVPAGPRLPTRMYGLTARGRALVPVLRALGRWASPLMGQRGVAEAFRPRWLAIPLSLFLVDRSPNERPLAIELWCGDEPMVLETNGGSVKLKPGVAEHPQARIEGMPELVMAVLLGRTTLSKARRSGLRFSGDERVLTRLQPPPQDARSLAESDA